MFSEILLSIGARRGLDRAIWLALLIVTATTIFSIALQQLSLGVLAVLCITTILKNPESGFRSTSLDLPVLAFIVGRAISVVFSVHPAVSVPALYIEIVFYTAFFVFTNTLRVDRDREIVILIQLLVLTAVVAAAIGSFKYIADFSDRASSTTSGPYTLSLYLIAVLPFALFLVGDHRIFKNRLLGYSAIAIIITGVIFSLNRLHWVAMVATLVVAIAINRDKIPLATFGLLFLASVLVIPEVAQRFQLTLTVFSHSTGRDMLWRGAGMLFAEHPLFGFGPRTFTEIFPLMSQLWDSQTGSWHNDFLQVYMDSGLVGLVPFVWVIIAAFSSTVATMRSGTHNSEKNKLLVPLTVALSVFVVVGGMLDTIVGIIFRLYLATIALMTAAVPGIAGLTKEKYS